MMKRLLALLSMLLVTVGLNAQSYTKVQCKVGNETITLPVPSQYVIVGRDAAWAANYFWQVENVMKDYARNRTVKIAMITKERYDFFNLNKQLTVDGFDSEVQCMNYAEGGRFTLADFSQIVKLTEEDFFPDADSLAKSVNDSSLTRDGMDRVRSMKSKDFKFISKSGRHFIFGINFTSESYTKVCALILVKGKYLMLYSGKPASEALACVAEMTKWVDEIEKTTPAEAPTNYFP